MNAEEIEKAAEIPVQYERRKPQYDEYLRWVGRIVLFQMCVLIALLLAFWMKLDRIYNGNPNSGGRELLCAIAKDDADADPKVALAYKEHCAEFHDVLDDE